MGYSTEERDEPCGNGMAQIAFIDAYVRHSFSGNRYPKAVRAALLAAAVSILILRAVEPYSIFVEYLVLGYFTYAVVYVGVWRLGGGLEWDRQQKEANRFLNIWQGVLSGAIGFYSFLIILAVVIKAFPFIGVPRAGLFAFLISMGLHTVIVCYFRRANKA